MSLSGLSALSLLCLKSSLEGGEGGRLPGTVTLCPGHYPSCYQKIDK